MRSIKQREPRKTVLVTGANGFIGNAVAKAFVTAGYRTIGLVRKNDALPLLERDEIIPILGSPDDPSTVVAGFQSLATDVAATVDVIISTTEDFSNYHNHFATVKRMLISIADISLANGVRPLVIFTSGCKDYGIGDYDVASTSSTTPTTTATTVSTEIKPLTETSPLRPPPVLLPRTTLSQTILECTDHFDAVVTRPTTLYGGSSSYYGPAFELASQAAASAGRTLRIPAPANSIMHGTHVSDVASAYVQLAESPRSKIAGQIYNISSWRYETAQEVADTLVREYGLAGSEFIDPTAAGGQPLAADGTQKQKTGIDVVGALFGFSQWIGSDKIRRDIGWSDRQPLFSEALHVYRRAYEAAALEKHSNVERIKGFVSAWNE